MDPAKTKDEIVGAAARSAPYPNNPVLVRVTRGGEVESTHRGAWVLVDTSGRVLDGAGAFGAPYFPRSAVKSFQAVPLVESGAADRFGFTDEDLALALASHNGEAVHTTRVARTLGRLGFTHATLRCGAHPPSDGPTRAELSVRGEEPTALHNNCSGKHTGFLALALQAGVEPEHYLDPESASQREVRHALASFTDVPERELIPAVDGCSAPTYRMPLRALALGFARMTTPDGLGSERAATCRRLTEAAARHPVLIAGTRKRLCTKLLEVSGGRLFPKIGAEAMYAVGLRGGDRAFAVKLDDGGLRGMHAVVLALAERLEWLGSDAMDALERFAPRVLTNHAGREVGTLEVDLEGGG